MSPSDLSLFCQIRCHSHLLNADAFEALLSPDSILDIRDITESTFFICLRRRDLLDHPGRIEKDEDFMAFATYLMSLWIMAFNIGSLGHFEWSAKKSSAASYSLYDHGEAKASGVTSRDRYKYPTEPHEHPLTKADVQRAMLVFTALAAEEKKYVRTEYLKGIYHFGFEFFDLTFRKDAFANFYRCFEYFITDRVLGVRRLRNELKQLSGGMRKVKLPETIIAMFKEEIYPLRSAQVMHSQTEQIEIEWDHVAKIKVLADATMNRLYQPQWEAELGAADIRLDT